MLAKNLIIALSSLVISSVVFAKSPPLNADASSQKGLTPGAKLLVGEPVPGEFLIVGQGEAMQVEQVFKPIPQKKSAEPGKNNAQQAIAPLRRDMSRPQMPAMEDLKRPAMPPILPARKENNKKAIPIENVSPKKAAFKNKHKLHSTKIKMALHKAIHKGSKLAVKAHAIKKIQTAQKRQPLIAEKKASKLKLAKKHEARHKSKHPIQKLAS